MSWELVLMPNTWWRDDTIEVCAHLCLFWKKKSSVLLDFFWYLKIALGLVLGLFFFFCLAQFLLYCEGTRFTETKHRISMEVAESKGLPKLKYHLLPRTKGFTTAVQCLRGTGTARLCSPWNVLFSTLCVAQHCLLCCSLQLVSWQ